MEVNKITKDFIKVQKESSYFVRILMIHIQRIHKQVIKNKNVLLIVVTQISLT